MLEFLGSGILGSLVGGLFRLAPEVLKFFDRKDERKHELAMLKEQLEYEKVKGELKVEERYVDFSVAGMQALEKAYEAQAVADSKAYKWVASLSAFVRPGIALIMFGVYMLIKLALVFTAFQTGVDWVTIANLYWTEEDFGMLSMVTSFYYVSRTLDRYRK